MSFNCQTKCHIYLTPPISTPLFHLRQQFVEMTNHGMDVMNHHIIWYQSDKIYESSSILYLIMNKTQKCSSCRSKSSVHEVPGPLSCGDNCSDFYRLLKLYRHFTAASAFQASDRFRAPPLRVTRCQICQRGCSSCDSPFSSRLHICGALQLSIYFFQIQVHLSEHKSPWLCRKL